MENLFKPTMSYQEMEAAFAQANPFLVPNIQHVGRFAKRHGYHRYQQVVAGHKTYFYCRTKLV